MTGQKAYPEKQIATPQLYSLVLQNEKLTLDSLTRPAFNVRLPFEVQPVSVQYAWACSLCLRLGFCSGIYGKLDLLID